jgi:hypothetical protein
MQFSCEKYETTVTGFEKTSLISGQLKSQLTNQGMQKLPNHYNHVLFRQLILFGFGVVR